MRKGRGGGRAEMRQLGEGAGGKVAGEGLPLAVSEHPIATPLNLYRSMIYGVMGIYI